MINDTSYRIVQQRDLNMVGWLIITLLQIYYWDYFKIILKIAQQLWEKADCLKLPLRPGSVLLKDEVSLEIWRIHSSITLRLITRRPPSADRTVRRQFRATGQPVSRPQASDPMASRLPRYEAKCVQRRCFQCGSVPFRSDIRGTGYPLPIYIFTAHAQERPSMNFRSTFWHHHSIPWSRFPYRARYFGDTRTISVDFCIG